MFTVITEEAWASRKRARMPGVNIFQYEDSGEVAPELEISRSTSRWPCLVSPKTLIPLDLTDLILPLLAALFGGACVLGFFRVRGRSSQAEAVDLLPETLQHAPSPAWLIGFDDRTNLLRILDCNELAAQLHGGTREQVMERSLSDSLVVTLEQGSIDFLVGKLTSGGVPRGRAQHRRLDGTTFEVKFAARAVWVGRKLRMLSMDCDLTDQPAARASDARYRAMVELCPDGVMLIDPSDDEVPACILECNERQAAMHGYTRAELIGRSLELLEAEPWPQGKLARFRDSIRDAEQRAIKGMAWHRRADGTTFPVDYHVRATELEGKRLLICVDRDATERLAAESRLRGREALLAKIFELSPDGMMLMEQTEPGGDLVLMDCSRRVGEMHGYAREEMLGKPLSMFDVVAAEIIGRNEPLHTPHSEGVLRGESVRMRKDGTCFPIEYGACYFEQDGRRFILGIDRETTDRVEAQKRLRAGEAMLRQTFAACPDSVLLMERLPGERDWVIRDCNERTCEMHGYTRAELIGVRISKINEQFADLAARNEPIEPLSTAELWTGESVHVRKNGTRFPIEFSTRYFQSGGGDFFVGVGRDITQRLAAEALQRKTFEACPDGVLLLEQLGEGHDMVIRDCNEGACVMHGYTREEMLGMRLSQLDVFTLAKIAHNTTVKFPQRQHLWRGESTHVRKDGTRFPIEFSVCHFELSGRHYFVGVDRDISEKRRLDAELMRSRTVRAMGELAGGVAHEFNNLLTPMVLQTELIAEQRGDDATLHAELQIIQKALAQAKALTQRILQLGRRGERRRQPMDVSAVLRDDLTLLRLTTDRRLRLNFSSAIPAQWVLADRSDLHQIVVNLLFNARDTLAERLSKQPRDWQPCIDVRLDWVDSSNCRLEVQDNGMGIPAEIRDRIFEPFFTTKDPNRGTGLGLATVWQLVHELGGRLEVQSLPDQGTTMSVFLPTCPPPSEAAEANADLATASPAPAPASGSAATPIAPARRILLVEDDELVARTTLTMLRRDKWQTEHARDGAAGLAAVARFAPDIILSDLNLPELNGLDLVKALRAQAWTGPIVVFSGHVAPEVRLQLEQQGVSAILYKPFAFEDLRGALRQGLTATPA
jgi:PAS domain S-box-containing protein